LAPCCQWDFLTNSNVNRFSPFKSLALLKAGKKSLPALFLDFAEKKLDSFAPSEEIHRSSDPE